MGRLYVLASAFRERLVGSADGLYGCSHRGAAFPAALEGAADVNGRSRARAAPYAVRPERGCYSEYGGTAVRATNAERPFRVRRRPVSRGERLLPQAVLLEFHVEAEANGGSR